MALCADSREDVTDLFLRNAPQEACVRQLRSSMGPPQPSVESIDPALAVEAEHGVPPVWFLSPA
jgi:hypothetical protein